MRLNPPMAVTDLLPGHDAHQQATHHKVARKDQCHLGVVDDDQSIQYAGHMSKRKIALGHTRDGLGPVFALPAGDKLGDVGQDATSIGSKEGPGHDVGDVFSHGSYVWVVGIAMLWPLPV